MSIVKSNLYKRQLTTPGDVAFFLFGPRGVGKSSWLKSEFPDAYIINLLPEAETIRFSKEAELLVRLIKALPKDRWIIIDEIQKVPQLLDDVHHLIEDHGYKKFILSGSSARKLKHGGANMLAGRALLRNMYPLTSGETDFCTDTYQSMQYGTLPGSINAVNDEMRAEFLKSYVTTYLAEEIKAEGIVRNIGDFARFLDIASLAAGTAPNLAGLARDAGISRDTVQSYFSIFTDTLLGSWLPAYRPRAKIKEVARPKFYWFDAGVLNAAAGGFEQRMPKDWDGILLEHFIHSEIKAYLDYKKIKGSLGYWATPSKSEVDFIHWYGEDAIAIEVKSNNRFRKDFLRGFKSLSDNLRATKFLIYLGSEELLIDDVRVLPVKIFLQKMYAGEIFCYS